ncbi:MAG: hypothetical protein V1902_00545 [Candidatus Falkowbacteria bacterium]
MKNAEWMIFAIACAMVIGCDSTDVDATDTDTSDPCALKGDRPTYCDEDVATDDDSEAPPIHYCGDNVCHTWDILHADPYVWESGTAEDCGNCAEDCPCNTWGWTCKAIGAYPDSWEGEKSECLDDPWYEFKLAITGTYEDEWGAQFIFTYDQFGYIPGCSCAFTAGDGPGGVCFTEPEVTPCSQPTTPPFSTWFTCDILANSIGTQMSQWCDNLPQDNHCADDCGTLGVKVNICGSQLWKVSHKVE